MKIYSVMNQKGGVGKTTTTLNVAMGLSAHGNRVLMVDLDPQGSLTACAGHDPTTLDKTIADLINIQIHRGAMPNVREYILPGQVDLLPANITLSVADLAMVTAIAREYILKSILEPLREEYDYILIDCPPTLGMLAMNALTTADEVLVPIKAQYLDVRGFDLLLDTIYLVQSATNPKLVVTGIIITMFDERLKLARMVKSELEEAYGKQGIYIFDTSVSTCTKVAESSVSGNSIYDYAAGSKAAAEYKKIVEELITREK